MKLEIKITYSMIRFDLKTEKWKKIATPFETNPGLSSTRTTCLSFTAVRVCIHLYLRNWNRNVKSIGRFVIELWRIDGDGDWTKMVTYNPLFYNLQSVLHLMKNGNWIIYSEFGISKVDVEKNIEEKLRSYTNIMNKIVVHPTGKYMETLGVNLLNQ